MASVIFIFNYIQYNDEITPEQYNLKFQMIKQIKKVRFNKKIQIIPNNIGWTK